MEDILSKSALAKRLAVSRSSLYYKPKMADKDELLRQEIEEIMKKCPGYGHKRVALALGVSRKRILRVMKKFNLKPARRTKPPCKPLDKGEEKGLPCVTKLWSPIVPNVLWTADFTYIYFKGRHIYFAVVQDRYTAFVLGARIMVHHNAELVVQTMLDALRISGEVPEWFHSDLGSEYASKEFGDLLKLKNVKVSASPKASPWRNPSQESFFGRFKQEFADPECFESLEELMSAIYQYVRYYNYERIHTRLKTTPYEFTERFKKSSCGKTYPATASSYQQPPPTSIKEGPFSEDVDNCSSPVDMPSACQFYSFH